MGHPLSIRQVENVTVPKSTPKPPSPSPAIRTVMMPRDTNADGTIFGGVILSLIDQAAYVEARRQAYHRYVTVGFKEVEFRDPVYVGDVLTLFAETERIGRTSITINVQVRANRRRKPDSDIHVTQAQVVFVAVDDRGNPVSVL
jgi:acyl-CoA thioesterase YciA